MKKIIKKGIKSILDDTEFWQLGMIIEEKEPFWWRFNPKWLEQKAQEIWVFLINESLIKK